MVEEIDEFRMEEIVDENQCPFVDLALLRDRFFHVLHVRFSRPAGGCCRSADHKVGIP
jgi:hypothetical protein